MFRAAFAAAAVALLIVGCSGAPGPAPLTPTSTATTAAANDTSEPTETESVPAKTSFSSDASPIPASSTASLEPSPSASASDELGSLHPWLTASSEREPRQTAGEWQEIIGVRTGAHDGYDRVVLDLSGEVPMLGWFAGFTDEAIEDPTGFPLEVDGDAFLELGIRAIDWTTDRPERFSGPVDADGLGNVTDVVFGGLFEAQQQILIGLEERTAYRIFVLPDPARIVIDIKHAD